MTSSSKNISTLFLKLKIFSLFPILFFSIYSQSLFAAATLKSADIVVVGMNQDGIDDFVLLALAEIPANSTIFITDHGQLGAGEPGNGFDTDSAGFENVAKWVTPATAIAAGTLIYMEPDTVTSSAIGTISITNFAGIAPAAWNLSGSGDQLIIFQTVDDTVDGTVERLAAGGGTEPGVLYAFNTNITTSGAVNGFSAETTDAQITSTESSGLAADLTIYDGTNPTTANGYGIAGFNGVERDDWVLKDPAPNPQPTTKDEWLTYIHSSDASTWLVTNGPAWNLTLGSGDGITAFTSVTVGSGNTAPTATGVPTDITVTEDAASNFDLSAVTLVDADGDSLTVTLVASAGVFSASSSGGVTVAGSASDTLTFAGTVADLNTYFDTTSNIQYTGAQDANGNNAATFTLNANDGTVDPEVGNGNIDILPVNDDPTMTSIPTDVTVTEDVASDLDLSAAIFSDVDSAASLINLTLTVAAGTLQGNDTANVSALDSGTASLTLSGTATDIDAYLNTTSNIQYTGANNANGNNVTTLTLTANDGGNTGSGGGANVNLGTVNIDILAVNDDPTMTSIPTDVTVTEDMASDLDLTAVVFADVDAGSSPVNLTLTVAAGTLQAIDAGGVTMSGSGTSSMNMLGSVADIDAYLNGSTNIKYTGASNANGNNVTTLTITANDGGNTGSGGGADVNLGTVNIDITPVNDAPSFNIIGDINVTQSNTLQEVFPAFAFNVDLGPNESNQNVMQYNLNVVSDTYTVISQVAISTAGDLTVDFTGNAGIAIVEVTLQDDGGTSNNGEDTSAPLSFFISYADLIFADGFETVATSISAYINAYKAAYPLQAQPYFDKENNLVMFYGYYFDTARFDASTTQYLFKNWLNEILMLRYFDNL